jgi:radical SAM superfamily enzyme YgiQ (UPF0313 family)
MAARDRIRVALISPKGPLYRHRGGIFGQTLRYMPLTLPTLAALIPDDLPVDLVCIDEGIADVDLALDVDLVGMTVITGTAVRAYELAAHFRGRGIPVVLGGPHVTLAPDDAAPNADCIVVGYAEETWPELLRDFQAGRMRARYDQRPDLDLAASPLPDRSVLPRWRYLTADVFEATRGCIHSCDFCVVPSAWGRRPMQKPVELMVEDIRRRRARQAIFIDLNIIADKEYAARLFEALIPLRIQWFGLATTLLADDIPLLDLAARSGCRGLLMGLESISRGTLRSSRKGFNDPARYKEMVGKLHARQIALQGCFVFGLDDDGPDVFQKTAEFAVDARIDLPRFAIVTPFPGTTLHRRLEGEGRILTRDWSLYDGQHAVFQPAGMDTTTLYQGTERAWKTVYGVRNTWRRLRHTAAPKHLALLTNFGYRRYAHNLDRFYTCDALAAPAWPRRERRLPVVEAR